MQFSLKWLLAGVTYVAVACATVVGASSWINVALAAALPTTYFVAFLGAAVLRRTARAFCLGYFSVFLAIAGSDLLQPALAFLRTPQLVDAARSGLRDRLAATIALREQFAQQKASYEEKPPME